MLDHGNALQQLILPVLAHLLPAVSLGHHSIAWKPVIKMQKKDKIIFTSLTYYPTRFHTFSTMDDRVRVIYVTTIL